MADVAAGAGPKDGVVEAQLERYARARQKRDELASLIDEAYDYTVPLRQRLSSRIGPRDSMAKLFDTTAMASVQNLASRLLFQMAPPTEPWFELRGGSQVPAGDREELDRALEPVTQEIRAAINNSDFYTQAHEALVDSTISAGILRIDVGDAVQPIRVRMVPLAEVVPGTGPFGGLDAYYFPQKVKLGHIATLWPSAVLTPELEERRRQSADQEIDLIEAVWRDWTHRAAERWEWRLIDPNAKVALDRSAFVGHGSSPVIGFRWSAAPGTALGYGPVLMALPDIRTINLTKQLILENADFAISGLFQADDDGTVNVDTIELIPGTIIPIAPQSRGLQPIQSPGRFDVGDLVLADLRQQIRQVLFDDDLGPPEGTPMSATEVMQRTALRAERTVAPYGRYLQEFLFPVVHRVAHVLRQLGRIKLPPIDGREIVLRPLSPLARDQAQDEILRHDRYVEMMSARFGPQQTALALKVDEYGRWLARQSGVKPELVRTSVEQQQVVEAMQALAAQQPGLAGG